MAHFLFGLKHFHAPTFLARIRGRLGGETENSELFEHLSGRSRIQQLGRKGTAAGRVGNKASRSGPL
jgi:hypothetical protein